MGTRGTRGTNYFSFQINELARRSRRRDVSRGTISHVSCATSRPYARCSHDRFRAMRTPLPHASPLLWWLVLALGLALAGAACTVRLGGRGSLIAHPRTALLHARRSGLVRRIPLRLGFPGALLMLLLGVALSMAACGGGGGVVSHAGTLAGTYTVTVTATATSGTASLTHKTTLTLTVQ
jgi:hypothetical protein